MKKTDQKTPRLPGRQARRENRAGYLFAAPAILGFLLFALLPILISLVASFTDWNMLSAPEFIGLQNYKNLLTEDFYFWRALKATFYYAILSVIISNLVALALALLLNANAKLQGVFRTIYYLPTVVPIVASAMLFLWVLNPEYGLLNNFLSWFGIRGPSWLSDPKFTKISLMIMDVWRCGQNTVIFLSALKAVPKSFYEAAELDGAGPVKRFFKITLPYISPTIQFLVVMGLISSFQYFTQAYVFASVSQVGQSITGGPQNSLLFYSMYLYMNGFSYMKMGYASAMAIVLFLIVLVVSFVAMYLMEKRVTYDVE